MNVMYIEIDVLFKSNGQSSVSSNLTKETHSLVNIYINQRTESLRPNTYRCEAMMWSLGSVLIQCTMMMMMACDPLCIFSCADEKYKSELVARRPQPTIEEHTNTRIHRIPLSHREPNSFFSAQSLMNSRTNIRWCGVV